MAGPAGRLTLAAVVLAAVGAAAATVDPVKALAGRYSATFGNAMVTGERYTSENIVEIVPVDARHAYVRMELRFFNGHGCSFAGVARAEGGALVYRGPPEDTFGDGAPCRLTLRRQGRLLLWDDAQGLCKGRCGARGSMRGDIAWVSKRPIRYLARLKRSEEYQGAVFEWRGR